MTTWPASHRRLRVLSGRETVEAMKMENEITAHKAGKIAELPIFEGHAVTAGDTLAVVSGE